MKRFSALALFLLLFVGRGFFIQPVFAVSVTIPNFPSVITADPFTITASISGAATGTNYIRIDVYKDGTQTYFGETYNGSDWCSGSSGKEYFPISVQSGKIWSGDVQARIGDITGLGYDGSGSYKMRIRRYTNSGNPGSEDPDNSAVSITINIPTPSPTSTPTPTFAPLPTPTNTLTPIPTRTPTPTKTPTPTATPKPTVTNDVLSDSSVSGENSMTETVEEGTVSTQSGLPIKIILIPLVSIGLGLAILSGVLVWQKRHSTAPPIT